jgi:hypothetical protein
MFYLAAIFLALLIIGRYMGELNWSHVLLCLFGAIAALITFRFLGWPTHFYALVLAALDVGLVFRLFKGDLQL